MAGGGCASNTCAISQPPPILLSCLRPEGTATKASAQSRDPLGREAFTPLARGVEETQEWQFHHFSSPRGRKKRERKKEPQCETATFHAVDTQPFIGTATSKIKKVVISGCIFAYVFEDVLGLSSPLKACHLITALSSVYSLVGTCQSPARQLILTDGLPLSSWCGAWVFVNT